MASICIALFLGVLVGRVFATWHGAYHLENESAKIWIRQDGSIDLFYNISIALDSGDDINRVYVGQPKSDFTIGEAKDQHGHNLIAIDASSGSDYKVEIDFDAPLKAGQALWFTLMTNVAHMIYEDKQNVGNVGMQFIPVWWPDAKVDTLNVSAVLPMGVNQSMVKTSIDWNSTSHEPDGALSIYWQKQNLSPNEQYTFGVSFPKDYVQNYEKEPSGINAFFQQYGSVLLVLGLVILVVVVIAIIVRKRPYMTPAMNMETLGVRHGLTAVEASYLLDFEPTKLVTEILYSLLHKRAVWVESATPALKLSTMRPFENKTGTRESPLRYYEIDFLNAIGDDGALDEEKLAQAVMLLRDTVEEKMHGYCRRDTIAYYRSVVSKAWEQVEQAGTPQLASNAYDEQLLWLLLDPEYSTRTQMAFRDRPFEPSPLWLWYWYGYQHYYPHPTYRPNIENPTQAAKPPMIPGSDFANNFVTAVATTSNNIVANLEKFANSILPMPAGAKASHEPAHHDASCVCACAACACACACVSCACACAGGGVG